LTEGCPRCRGLGFTEERTGGTVEIDGARWSYLRYRGLTKNPSHVFWQTEHKIGNVTICHGCAGRGVISLASVIGFFFPNAISYVTDKANDDQGLVVGGLHRLRSFATKNLTELRAERPRRGFSDWATGIYAVTEMNEQVAEWVSQFVMRIGRKAEVHGGFVAFDEPVIYQGPFFMGLKKWTYPGLEDFVKGGIL
jgi:hypothetical protein